MKNKTVIMSVILFVAAAAFSFCFFMESTKVVIVIDPGHGGTRLSHKGYVSSGGIEECTLNNAVALKLQTILSARGYKAVFTKPPGDEAFLTLQQRPEAANEAQADLFISIHHDAGSSAQTRGFGIFYSSYKVGSDNEDLTVIYKNKEYPFIAERIEDDGDGGSYSVVTAQNGLSVIELNSIADKYTVIDKSPCPAALESKKFAEILYGRMTGLQYIQPKKTIEETVSDQEFRVLRYSGMPSVLIECGYMTNAAELAEIRDEGNQQALALAVADAVDDYFGRDCQPLWRWKLMKIIKTIWGSD